MEERRLLLAVALSLLILTGYSLLFGPGGRPPGETPETTPASSDATPLPPTPSEPEASSPLEGAGEADPRPTPKVAAELEQRVEVLGPDFTIAFSNRGARLLSWTLTRYRTADDKPGAVRSVDPHTAVDRNVASHPELPIRRRGGGGREGLDLPGWGPGVDLGFGDVR